MKYNRFLVTAMTLCTIALMTTGCSAVMAATKKKEPKTSVIKIGGHRGEVELQLGSAVRVENLQEGKIRCYYLYSAGSNPGAGRAIGHGVMDVLTLGLWEVVGTPIEIAGDKRKAVAVTYDMQGVITNVELARPSKKRAIRAELVS